MDPAQLAMMMAANLQSYVGKRGRVRFLTSERG
jgi:hypothetical protein